jgi:hypothetical protein
MDDSATATAILTDSKHNEVKVLDEKEHISPSVSNSLEDDEPDLEFPTEEERETLRRVADTVPWNAYRERATFLLYHSVELDLIYSNCNRRIGGTILGKSQYFRCSISGFC